MSAFWAFLTVALLFASGGFLIAGQVSLMQAAADLMHVADAAKEIEFAKAHDEVWSLPNA